MPKTKAEWKDKIGQPLKPGDTVIVEKLGSNSDHSVLNDDLIEGIDLPTVTPAICQNGSLDYEYLEGTNKRTGLKVIVKTKIVIRK